MSSTFKIIIFVLVFTVKNKIKYRAQHLVRIQSSIRTYHVQKQYKPRYVHFYPFGKRIKVHLHCVNAESKAKNVPDIFPLVIVMLTDSFAPCKLPLKL